MGKEGLRSTSFTQSTKSLRSIKSISSHVNGREKPELGANEAASFEKMVIAGCNKFRNTNTAYRVVVKRDTRSDEFFTTLKRGVNQAKLKKSQCKGGTLLEASLSMTDILAPKGPHESTNISIRPGETTLVITVLNDSSNKLSEILFYKQQQIRREHMQILGLVIPHFPNCTKMSFKNCRVNGYIIHEMKKFLPLTSITELGLDDCPLSESCYSVLLDKLCRVTSLSLCRCKIDDDSCVRIASKLHFSEPAADTLAALNLSSNHITDIGAKSIGEALRTNRHLRYLNLADNRISDDGADRILYALIDFALTYDEIVRKRRNYFDFLRARQQFRAEFGSDWDSKSMPSTYRKPIVKKKNKPKKDKSLTILFDDTMLYFKEDEMITKRNIDQVVDLFTPTKLVDGYPYCTGNMVLCYLNLSYNELSHFFVKKLRSILLKQHADKKLGQTGLLKVVIDGNPVPVSDDDLDCIGGLLQRNVIQSGPRSYGTDSKRISRMSRVIQK